MADKSPSVTFTKSAGCGPLHVNVVYAQDGTTVKRITPKYKRNGTCAAAMADAMGSLASLAIKKGATVEEVAKKLSGIGCQHPVMAMADDSGCASCADALSIVLMENLVKRDGEPK